VLQVSSHTTVPALYKIGKRSNNCSGTRIATYHFDSLGYHMAGLPTYHSHLVALAQLRLSPVLFYAQPCI